MGLAMMRKNRAGTGTALLDDRSTFAESPLPERPRCNSKLSLERL